MKIFRVPQFYLCLIFGMIIITRRDTFVQVLFFSGTIYISNNCIFVANLFNGLSWILFLGFDTFI